MFTSGYSSFTDSQLFLGSQLWPDNSPSLSQDVSLSSSSQEGSDPKFSNSYHTKPLLFGELKGKTKSFGILDKFEEDRRREKENSQSSLFAKEHQQTREILNNIQQLVTNTEGHTAESQTALVTLKNGLKGLQGDISQHFQTLADKVGSQSKAMTELEESVKKSTETAGKFHLTMQSFKSSLESLKEQQERERNMLEEALKLLNSLVSEHTAKISPPRLKDSTTQSSPGLEKLLPNILQDIQPENAQPPCALSTPEKKQVQVPLRPPSCKTRNRKLSLKGHIKHRKRPLAPPYRSKLTASNENRPSWPKIYRKRTAPSPVVQCRNMNTGTSQESLHFDHQSIFCREPKKSVRSHITPLTCWSQDSNNSVALTGVENILEKLEVENKKGTSVQPHSLWQLFDMN